MHIQEGIDISNDQGNINWSHPQLNPSDSGKQFINVSFGLENKK
ncbi:hypothetical protein [Cardinium endosymbiont of Tipula unca]